MGLFESNKPRWRHKDPEVRLESIESIDPGEVELLAELGGKDPDQRVRRAAINRITDLKTLSRLAEVIDPEDFAVLAARQEILLAGQVAACRDPEKGRADLDRITSPGLLAELAVHADMPEIRQAAVQRIDDQFLLAEIVKQNCGKKPAMAAMENITDEALLADLQESAAGRTARRLAAEKIAELERQRNPASDRETVDRRLNGFAGEAAALMDNPDMDAAALRMEAIREEWEELDREHAHPAYAEFSRINNDFAARYREVMARRQTSQEKTARYEQLQDGMEKISETIERLSCSTADDAETVKEKAVADWETLVHKIFGDLVPDASMTKRFNDACRAFDANRERIEQERGHIKVLGGRCRQAQQLIADSELKQAGAQLREIEKSLAGFDFKYFNQGAIEKLVAEMAADLELAEEDGRSRNLTRRQEICAELERVAQSSKPSHLARQLQSLQEEWQQLGKPGNAEAGELEQRFVQLVAGLTERLKTLEHEQDWQLWANLKLKEKLKEKVTALDEEENLETVFNAIKQAQAEWKEIGPVPQTESQALWNAFQDACNRNFERAKPYLEERKIKRAEAMDRRREICGLAAELAESSEWQQTTGAFKGLQAEWKNLPHGSRSQERKLYTQFRKSCDRFFARRAEHYQHLDEARQVNLVAKEKLCEEAEQLAAAPKLDNAGEFKRLQAEWRKIGPVPHKNREKIWKRFRAAGDSYFNWLGMEKEKNLKQKEELCATVEKLVAEANPEDDQKKLKARLAELQQRWKEIGPVPGDRNREVWQRFRKPVDTFFAARKVQYEQEERQRRANQDKKEDILARAEELAGRDKNKETTEQLQELQQRWSAIGPAPRDVNRELNERFKILCDAYFAGRRQHFAERKAEELENQKKKESLCLRLENIIGLTPQTRADESDKALSLAEELKQAMEDNFMLAGRRDKKDIGGEVKRIEQEWKTIGPVPPRQIRPLADRFRKALDAYYAGRGARNI